MKPYNISAVVIALISFALTARVHNIMYSC